VKLPPSGKITTAFASSSPRASSPTSADVVFVAHTGLEHLSTVRDLYRGLPMDTHVLMRWDFFEAKDVPRDRQEQADWLFERWAAMDRWSPSAATATDQRYVTGPVAVASRREPDEGAGSAGRNPADTPAAAPSPALAVAPASPSPRPRMFHASCQGPQSTTAPPSGVQWM
jgi:hypothetical protein